MSLTGRLRAAVPDEVVLVGESGIRTAQDVAGLAAAGADAILTYFAIDAARWLAESE